MTATQQKQLSELLTLAPQARQKEIERLAFEADVCPSPERKQELETLLLLVSKADMASHPVPAARQIPEPFTAQEVWGIASFLLAIILPICAAVLVVGITGALLFGLFDAIRAVLWENRAVIGILLSGLVFAVLASALPKVRFSRGEEEGEVTHEKWERTRYYEHESYERTVK